MSLGKRFFVSASTLISSTIIAQAITFGASFILTRLYSPSEYGHYSIFMGIGAALGVASTGALHRVILLGGSDEEVKQVSTTVFASSMACAGVVSLLGLGLKLTGQTSLIPLEPADLQFHIPVLMVCLAGGQVFIYSSLRANTVRILAAAKIGQNVLMAGVQILLAQACVLPGLVIGAITGWFLFFMMGLRWRLKLGLNREDFALESLVKPFRKHSRYPRYVVPNELLDNLSHQLPIYFIGAFLSLSDAGQYGLAIMMLSAPAAVVGQSVSQAFLQHMSLSGGDPADLRSATYKVWLGLAALGLVPFGAILAAGPRIFEFGFGEQWTQAGQISQWLSLLLLCRFISSPTSSLFWKLELQRAQWYFVLAAATYRAAIYCSLFFGIELRTAIIAHVTIEIFAIVCANLFVLSRLKDWST